VVGSEEAMPILFRIPVLGRLLRLPYFPVTANMVAMGPLGILIPFPAKIRLRVMDPVSFDVPPDLPRYSRSKVMEAAESVRADLQQTVYDLLSERRSVWFG
jgi:hypothetical protein